MGLWSLVLQKTANWQKYESVTAQEWITRRMGKEAYQVIWEPLLRGKFGENYDQISMTWLWGKFRLRVSSRRGILARERLGYPMGSFGEVFDTLGEQIERQGGDIHLSTRVQRVVVEAETATGLEVQLPDHDPEIRSYDVIIATTPSYIFTRLVPPLPEAYQERLVNVRYLAAVVLILALDRPLSDKYWMNIADLSLPFVGVIEHTNLVDPALYGGNHLVYLTNYPSRDSDLYQMSAEELLAAYLPHLQKINPQFDPSWVKEYFHHKIDGAQPIIGVNYGQRIPDHRTPFRNLYLVNTTQIYPEDRGTNYSVRMGRQVARMVLEDTQTGR